MSHQPAIRYYVNYIIFFRNIAEFELAISVAGGQPFLELDPFHAANLFGIPWPLPSGDLLTLSKGMYGFPPFGIPASPGPGVEIGFPLPSGVFLKSDQPFTNVPGQTGNPPGHPGPDGIFIWSAAIVLAGPQQQADSFVTGIPQRRWFNTFDWDAAVEQVAGTSIQICRDSSRTVEGYGLCIRGSALGMARLNNQYRSISPLTSWERFYIRIRRATSVTRGLTWYHNPGFANLGLSLDITSSNSIQVNLRDVIGTPFLLGSAGNLGLNVWHRIDVLLRMQTTGRIIVFMDGVQQFDSGLFGGLFGAGHSATNSFQYSDGDTQFECDFDDWVSSDIPANYDSNLNKTNNDFPIDWLVGSHNRTYILDPDFLSSTDWTGSKGTPNQLINYLTVNATLTSSTALAKIEGATDINLMNFHDTYGLNIGITAAIVCEASANSNNSDGQVGYRIAGGLAVLTTIDQTVALKNFGVGYLPSGLLVPTEVSPFSIVHHKSNDGISTDTVHAIQAMAENIGIWGPEDNTAAIELFDRTKSYHHNSNYFNSVYGMPGPVSDAPVFTLVTTYAGNGTHQRIVLPHLCHFLIIRRVDSPQEIIFFIAASLGATRGSTGDIMPGVLLYYDGLVNDAVLLISGNNARFNASGGTYQIIAFCDAGMRFNICGCFAHHNTGTHVNNLIDDNFTPVAAFIQRQYNLLSANDDQTLYKGPGMGANAGRGLGGTAYANTGSFALGIFNSLGDLHTQKQVTYSMWRTNEINCDFVPVQITSYVGDGISPKVITLSPLADRPAVFVLVSNPSGQSYIKDPSHLSNESSRIDGTIVLDAIIDVDNDQITVSSALNTNGVTYDVFALTGANMINGIYSVPECLPTMEWPTPEEPQGDIVQLWDGGLILGGENPNLILKDVSGIYTLVPGKHDDTLIDRQTEQTSVDVEIPDPTFKTGYIGG